MRRWQRFLPLLAIGLAAIVPLARAVFAGQAIGAFDQIRHLAPWNGPAPSGPWDVLQADGVLQFYPWRHMVFDAWGKGQLPLWNPYELAGTPLLANSQSGGFYPLHVLIGMLHIPTAPAMTFLAWFHLMWAGLGVYALSRRLGASRLGGVVGGTSFALTPFMLDWTALPSVITTVAWIPWVLLGVWSILRPEPGNDLNLRSRFRSVGLLALSVGMMILAGHLQFVAYGLMAAVLIAVLLLCLKPESGSRPSAKPVLACAAGLILGVLLAAPQLLPVVQYGKFSHRQNAATSVGYTDYVKHAIKPFELANLTVANALGSPREELGNEVDHQVISSYWPVLLNNGDNLAESAVTIGPLVLALLFLVPWKRREVWPIAVMSALALLFALGTPLNALLYFGVPNWSATGSPGRMVVLFVLGASVLAALGVDRGAKLGSKWKLGLLLCPGIIGEVLAVVLPSLAPDAGRAEQLVSALKGAATSEAMVTVFIASGLAALGVALMLYPEAAKYRRALVVFPVVIAWVGYASNLVPTGEPLPISNDNRGQQRIAVINTNWGIQVAPTAILPPNTASLSGLHELGGYDSLLHRDTVSLLRDIDGNDPAPPENGNMMFVKPGFDIAKLAASGVTQIYSATPIPNLPQTGALATIGIYDLPGPGRISGDGGSATIADDGYDHQTIDVGPGTKSVLERDRRMPGWIDTRTGAEVGGTVWRTMEVAPSQTKIQLKYDPPGLKLGLAVGSASWLALLAMVWPGRPRTNKESEGT